MRNLELTPRSYTIISNVEGSVALKKSRIEEFVTRFSLDGTEIFASSLVPREEPLFRDADHKKVLVDLLTAYQIKRVHMSYWAEPVDFLVNIDRPGLKKRFGTENDVANYYSDTTGEHVFTRWKQEYELAAAVGAESVTFHVIDYFHIDGLWKFTNSKAAILDGFTQILQKLLDDLEIDDALEKGPSIELENAGFGLEYGAQTANDFEYILGNVRDKHGKLKIGWDINHLLHAVGYDTKTKTGKFFLPPGEVTEEMKILERKYGSDYYAFCLAWLEMNVCDPHLIQKIGSLHLSDAPKKTRQIFTNGQLSGSDYIQLMSQKTPVEMEEYGAALVGTFYDAHLPLHPLMSGVSKIISALREVNPDIALLHELKNNELDVRALQKQLKSLLQ